jgi:hypothetical protein
VQVTYTPPSAAGTYTFIYTASDGTDTSNVATATITVTDPPPPPADLSVTGITPNVISRNAGTVTFAISGTGCGTSR